MSIPRHPTLDDGEFFVFNLDAPKYPTEKVKPKVLIASILGSFLRL